MNESGFRNELAACERQAYAKMRRMGLQSADADDVWQRASIEAYRAYQTGRLTLDEPLDGFVMTIVYRRAVNHIRRHPEMRTVQLQFAENRTASSDPYSFRAEAKDWIALVGAELGPTLDLLIKGFTHRQIAERLSLPLRRVSEQIKEIQLRVKNFLAN